MKRIKFACLEQTIHFMLKDDVPNTIAVRAVAEEYKAYKAQIPRKAHRHLRTYLTHRYCSG